MRVIFPQTYDAFNTYRTAMADDLDDDLDGVEHCVWGKIELSADVVSVDPSTTH